MLALSFRQRRKIHDTKTKSITTGIDGHKRKVFHFRLFPASEWLNERRILAGQVEGMDLRRRAEVPKRLIRQQQPRRRIQRLQQNEPQSGLAQIEPNLNLITAQKPRAASLLSTLSSILL